MNYSEIKAAYKLAFDLDLDPRELVSQLSIKELDFDIDNYRFIQESNVFDIVKDSYECDPYILGYFNDWFISDNCSIPLNVVEALQKAECFEALGELMLRNGIDELIKEYIRLDGPGHALNSYDHSCDEININGLDYIYFRAS